MRLVQARAALATAFLVFPAVALAFSPAPRAPEAELFSAASLRGAMEAVRKAGQAPPPVAVTFAPGVDRSSEAELTAAARSLARRFPVLFSQSVVSGIEVIPASRDPKAKPDCGYDETSLRIRIQASCLEYVRSGVTPGLYRPGAGIEPLLFHEALHGYHIQLDEKSGGNLPLDYDAATGDRVKSMVMELWDWFKAQDWTGRDAEVYPAKDAKELELLRAKGLPQRDPTDTHAGTLPGELYAYAGEFFFYAAAPDRWLSVSERIYWIQMGVHLEGRGPLPPLPGAR